MRVARRPGEAGEVDARLRDLMAAVRLIDAVAANKVNEVLRPSAQDEPSPMAPNE
jgi:hypothetical protein